MDPRINTMVLWAWVGEDDMPGVVNGKMGLKIGVAPCGTCPMVACEEGKIDQDYIVKQMQILSSLTGKNRYLCRFTFDMVVQIIEPRNASQNN